MHDDAILRYLQDVLGLPASIAPWPRASPIPYSLHDHFDLRELTLLGEGVLVAKARHRQDPGLGGVRRALDALRTLSGRPALYVTDALASYERRRLVSLRVPFLVPGNQLYLPDLGVDLREYFRASRPQAAELRLSPATQAVLITHLLHRPWHAEWRPAEVVAALGYTPMTATRCVRELATAGIATMHTRDRQRVLYVDREPRALWEFAKPMLRSPVKRTVWLERLALLDSAPHEPHLAGLGALARLTQLSEPPWRTYALNPDEWTRAMQGRLPSMPARSEGCDEWQLWSYGPLRQLDSRLVDLLSLVLSLQQENDPRVLTALDELVEALAW